MEAQKVDKVGGNNTADIIQCPECEQDIQVADCQEGDTFTCPHCSVDLQVAGVDPIWVDFAPETERDWEKSKTVKTLTLDEVEELEDEEEELDDEETWTEAVSRRVATLRPSRVRPQPQRELGAAAEGVVYLTPEGAVRLRQELERLKTVRLPKVTAWVSDALSEGFEDEDVTELEAARSELALIEGRIRSLERLLTSVEFLPEPENKETIQLGSRVTIIEGDSEPETYRIVSPAEANPLNGFISHVSPLGMALMGHRVGDRVVVASPDGPIEFRIEAIS